MARLAPQCQHLLLGLAAVAAAVGFVVAAAVVALLVGFVAPAAAEVKTVATAAEGEGKEGWIGKSQHLNFLRVPIHVEPGGRLDWLLVRSTIGLVQLVRLLEACLI